MAPNGDVVDDDDDEVDDCIERRGTKQKQQQLLLENGYMYAMHVERHNCHIIINIVGTIWIFSSVPVGARKT